MWISKLLSAHELYSSLFFSPDNIFVLERPRPELLNTFVFVWNNTQKQKSDADVIEDSLVLDVEASGNNNKVSSTLSFLMHLSVICKLYIFMYWLCLEAILHAVDSRPDKVPAIIWSLDGL